MTKVLVTYGSRYGSTKEIAEFMAETIKEMGHGVDLHEASKAPSSIDEYDVVLIGGGIQMGKWKNTALKFLKKHQKALREKRIGLFVSCMSSMYPEKIEESTQEYLSDVGGKFGLEPAGLGLFGGCLDFTGKNGLVYRISVNFMKKDLEEMGIEYDKTYEFRDWPRIKEWTEGLVS